MAKSGEESLIFFSKFYFFFLTKLGKLLPLRFFFYFGWQIIKWYNGSENLLHSLRHYYCDKIDLNNKDLTNVYWFTTLIKSMPAYHIRTQNIWLWNHYPTKKASATDYSAGQPWKQLYHASFSFYSTPHTISYFYLFSWLTINWYVIKDMKKSVQRALSFSCICASGFQRVHSLHRTSEIL